MSLYVIKQIDTHEKAKSNYYRSFILCSGLPASTRAPIVTRTTLKLRKGIVTAYNKINKYCIIGSISVLMLLSLFY